MKNGAYLHTKTEQIEHGMPVKLAKEYRSSKLSFDTKLEVALTV
jgi:hypothetical protein